MKEFLLHRYLHNLQLGMNCLQQNTSVKTVNVDQEKFKAVIKLPYYTNGHPLTIYAHSINCPAWDVDDKGDFPILLTDKGQILQDLLTSQPKFRIVYLTAWQLEISDTFNAILDMQAPREIKYKYDYMNGSNTFNITSLTYYRNFSQQLCSFISFMITVKDVYRTYFQNKRE